MTLNHRRGVGTAVSLAAAKLVVVVLLEHGRAIS